MRQCCFIFLILFCSPLYGQNSNYSVSYLSRGVFDAYQNWDQDEINFSVENTYGSSQKFTQLYRWRYLYGELNGLIFEYNNRFYLAKNDRFNNSFFMSSWYIQAKVGHAVLRGKTYLPNTIRYYDPILSREVFNSGSLEDDKHYVVNSGLGIGYKFIHSKFFSLDLGVGFLGVTQPNFIGPAKNYRLSTWKNTIMSPIEVNWSLGFLVDHSK